MPTRKTPVNGDYQTGALTALTARTIISPASNTVGIKIAVGSCFDFNNGFGHFVIAASAPTTMTGGVVVSSVKQYVSGAPNYSTHKIVEDLFIPAGTGLYWINDLLSTNTRTDVSWSNG